MSHHHKVLSNLYTRQHLIERGKENGLNWEQHPHEGVNWMRFNSALKNHLTEDGHFDTGEHDVENLKQMKEHYTSIKEMHKQHMSNKIRHVMSKLHQNNGDPNKNMQDFLHDAHDHLNEYGGHDWSHKVQTLHNLNHHIQVLDQHIGKGVVQDK